MFIDARAITSGSEYACDICIVGAGPAGISIAERLSGAGISIILLESGGFDPEIETQLLFRGENTGHEYYSLDSCRWRFFGGGTNRWGGWCRPLDPIDFEHRDWVEWSGWPINAGTLEPYYSDTATLLGLSKSTFDLAAWNGDLPEPLSLESTSFENALIQFNRVPFGRVYREKIRESKNVTAMLYANLVELKLAADSSRVDILRIATLSGRSFTIRPREIVLAAGGIENARLLLSSRTDRANGIGNEHGLVGRFFMEHLHVGAGHLASDRRFSDSRFYQRQHRDSSQPRGFIVPRPEALVNNKLLATSISVEGASYAPASQEWKPRPLVYEATRAYRKAQAGRLKPVVETVMRNVLFASSLRDRYKTALKARAASVRAGSNAYMATLYSLYFRAEQAPNPESRVTLSTRRDALNVPEVELHWKINPTDLESIEKWLELFGNEMQSRGFGNVIKPVDDWKSEIKGGPHHMGTTRMSADQRHGVVDEQCKVHSVKNLYIAGSSVFATGGYANPTFSLIALALRLAERLRTRLTSAALS